MPMAITKTKAIDWNFGEKHKDYIRRCRDNTINVAEGAVRAGKTIDNTFAFAMELERTSDKIHIATGSTGANAKLNIGEANGFGLEHIFRGRSRWGKFKGNECIYVNTQTGQKVVIFAGAAKANSYKSIRGNSYGMWIATEINLHHEDTIKECFNRTLMADNRKMFWDLNPSPPKHKIYINYIDKYDKQQKENDFPGGYNYQHFTIFDNINLTEERVAQIISEYDPNSLWYKRDIEGKRMVAEGLIYRNFAENYDKFLVDKTPDFMQIVIGVDFGGNGSQHAFVATGITRGYREVVALVSERHEAKDVDPDELNKIFIKFLYRVIDLYEKPDVVYVDSAEQTLKNGFTKAVAKAKLGIPIRNAAKKQIVDRIRLESTLIATKRLKYTKHCDTLVEALSTAVWDPKEIEDIRLDDGTSDIDTLDAFEYTIERYMKALIHTKQR